MKKIISIAFLLLLSVASPAQVKHYKLKVISGYPHDTNAYTQGLFFHDGVLYESTGRYGSSSLRRVDLKSGKPLKSVSIPRKYFAEGSVVLDGKLFLLSWTNKVAFIYNPKTFERISTFSYPREGWGLTTDGRSLIASDGSANLYFMGKDFKLHKRLKVVMPSGSQVKYLNELEWIDGKIWANVYLTDFIVIINPETGIVESIVDCAGLLPEKLKKPETDVLNGIAVDGKGKIFLTGKNWPRIYEVALVPVD